MDQVLRFKKLSREEIFLIQTNFKGEECEIEETEFYTNFFIKDSQSENLDVLRLKFKLGIDEPLKKKMLRSTQEFLLSS